jgi:hypothetical protein
MALQKDRTRLNVKGGGLLKIRQLTSGGAETTMLDVGYLDETTFTIEGDFTVSQSEDGQVVEALTSGEVVKIKSVLKQSTKDEIDVIATAEGKYFHAYYYCVLGNGNYQEIYIALCKINPNLSLEYKRGTERKVPIEIVALTPKGTVTVTPSAFNTTPPAVFVMTEAGSAYGQVTTATGTIYSAAV